MPTRGEAGHPPRVDLWRIDARHPIHSLSELLDLLSPAERDRAQAFRFTECRDRFLRHHGGLRRILAAYCGLPPHQIELGTGPRGKPHLVREDGAPLNFNLSHTGDLAVVAICAGGEVGIDIEDVAAGEWHQRMAHRVLSPAERREFDALGGDARGLAFLRCWTRKEACLKATGEGLSVPLEQVSVGFAGRTGSVGRGPHWHFHELAPWPGVVGALAIEVADATLCWFDLEDLPAALVQGGAVEAACPWPA